MESRAQSDREKFIHTWREIIENTDNLYLWQDSVKELTIKDNTITGVVTNMDVSFSAKSVIITSGTFMNGLMHIGKTQLRGGRISEPASYGITEQLSLLGITVGRMKTGTPVLHRRKKRSFRPNDRTNWRKTFINSLILILNLDN